MVAVRRFFCWRRVASFRFFFQSLSVLMRIVQDGGRQLRVLFYWIIGIRNIFVVIESFTGWCCFRIRFIFYVVVALRGLLRRRRNGFVFKGLFVCFLCVNLGFFRCQQDIVMIKIDRFFVFVEFFVLQMESCLLLRGVAGVFSQEIFCWLWEGEGGGVRIMQWDSYQWIVLQITGWESLYMVLGEAVEGVQLTELGCFREL